MDASRAESMQALGADASTIAAYEDYMEKHGNGDG